MAECQANYQNLRQNKLPQKSILQSSVSQMLLIQQQTDLINRIVRNQISSAKCHTFSTEISQLSFQSFDKGRCLNSSLSAISLCRQYSRFFQDDSTQEVLAEIRRCCSKKTYSFVRNKLQKSIQSKQEGQLQKQRKHNEQLTQKCLKLTQEVESLKIKLESANQKLKQQEKNKKYNKIQHPSCIEKGQLLLKWQKSMLYKQKIQNQTKKNLNKQFKMLSDEQKQNQSLRQYIQQLLMKMQQINGDQNNTAIQQCVQQIRILLQKQRIFVQKQHQDYFYMQNVVEQAIKQLKRSISKELD